MWGLSKKIKGPISSAVDDIYRLPTNRQAKYIHNLFNSKFSVMYSHNYVNPRIFSTSFRIPSENSTQYLSINFESSTLNILALTLKVHPLFLTSSRIPLGNPRKYLSVNFERCQFQGNYVFMWQ